jgi:predicted RNase H-like HicB family nuclease
VYNEDKKEEGRMKFTVILESEEEGGYSIHCPALPGCHSQGETKEEALANIKEAILLCLEVISEEGCPIPEQNPEAIAEAICLCLQDRAEDGLPLTIETQEVEVVAEIEPHQPNHIAMTNAGVPKILSIPDHRELKRGTLRALIRDAGLTVEEFIELLHGK